MNFRNYETVKRSGILFVLNGEVHDYNTRYNPYYPHKYGLSLYERIMRCSVRKVFNWLLLSIKNISSYNLFITNCKTPLIKALIIPLMNL